MQIQRSSALDLHFSGISRATSASLMTSRLSTPRRVDRIPFGRVRRPAGQDGDDNLQVVFRQSRLIFAALSGHRIVLLHDSLASCATGSTGRFPALHVPVGISPPR